jgi:hypothetical protein
MDGFLRTVLKNGALVVDSRFLGVDFDAASSLGTIIRFKRKSAATIFSISLLILISIAVSAIDFRIQQVDGNAAADVIGETDLEIGVAAGESHRHDIAQRGLVGLHRIVVLDRQKLDGGVVIDFIS